MSIPNSTDPRAEATDAAGFAAEESYFFSKFDTWPELNRQPSACWADITKNMAGASGKVGPNRFHPAMYNRWHISIFFDTGKSAAS